MISYNPKLIDNMNQQAASLKISREILNTRINIEQGAERGAIVINAQATQRYGKEGEFRKESQSYAFLINQSNQLKEINDYTQMATALITYQFLGYPLADLPAVVEPTKPAEESKPKEEAKTNKGKRRTKKEEPLLKLKAEDETKTKAKTKEPVEPTPEDEESEIDLLGGEGEETRPEPVIEVLDPKSKPHAQIVGKTIAAQDPSFPKDPDKVAFVKKIIQALVSKQEPFLADGVLIPETEAKIIAAWGKYGK